jgi:hypothetical protein
MKETNITIRLSHDEKEILRKLAKANNVTISKYMMYSSLLGKKLKITKIVEVEG